MLSAVAPLALSHTVLVPVLVKTPADWLMKVPRFEKSAASSLRKPPPVLVSEPVAVLVRTAPWPIAEVAPPFPLALLVRMPVLVSEPVLVISLETPVPGVFTTLLMVLLPSVVIVPALSMIAWPAGPEVITLPSLVRVEPWTPLIVPLLVTVEPASLSMTPGLVGAPVPSLVTVTPLLIVPVVGLVWLPPMPSVPVLE